MSHDALAEEFMGYRPRLLGIAYRMLGSMWDAEDTVADAMVRWLRVDRTQVREPVAYLTTMVTRLALDHLKSARVNREHYVGPWLPEPALTDTSALGPLDTIERRESVSLATLRLMEQLSPPERAVFVLREAFDIPYPQIAEILDITTDSARQLLHRAHNRIGAGGHRFDADPDEHRELFERFIEAVRCGDLEQLQELLAADVVSYSDGGGKTRAARHPITGAERVLRFYGGLFRRYPPGRVDRIEANGRPAAIIWLGGRHQFVSVDVRAGRIVEIDWVLNPDKLAYVEHQRARDN